MRNRLIPAAILVSATMALGCSKVSEPKAPASAPAPSTRPAIAQPCPFDRVPSPTESTPAQPRVLVELAVIEGDLGTAAREAFSSSPDKNGPPSNSSFTAFLSDPRFNIPMVANVLASNHVSHEVPWTSVRGDPGPGCPATPNWALSVTPHMQPVQPSDLSLDIALVPTPDKDTTENSKQVPNHCHPHTTVTVKDQQTILLGGLARTHSPKKHSVLVVTPYIVWNDADLRTLLECKVRRLQKVHPGQ